MNFAFLIILTTAANALFCFPEHFSQTYMQTRPVYANLNAQNQFWNEIAFEKNSCKNSHTQIITYYQKSTSTPSSKKDNELTQYFLMEGKNKLTVMGDSFSTQQQLDRDIRAEWLGLPSSFSGTFTLFPSQKQSGFVIETKKCFVDADSKSFLNNFWFGTAIYFSNVENNLNIKESIISATTSTSKTIISQLSRSDLKAGRFTPCKSCSTGFSEIRLRFGTHFNCTNDLHIAMGSFFSIPLVDKPVPTHMFTANRGYNGHLGWGQSLSFQFPLNSRCANYQIQFFANGENLFFIKSKEMRLLDLLNKPFSRFMLFNKNNGETNILATKVLTQEVEVQPYNYADIIAGFKIRQNSFVAEINYGLWVHPSERLTLVNEFKREHGIAAPSGSALTPGGIAPTASASTIKTQESVDLDSDSNTEFDPIKENEIDLESGAARSALTHKAEFSIGLIRNGKCCNVTFGLGAFAEIPHNNSALKNAGFWAKVAASF
jgi:hypothetical protein